LFSSPDPFWYYRRPPFRITPAPSVLLNALSGIPGKQNHREIFLIDKARRLFLLNAPLFPRSPVGTPHKAAAGTQFFPLFRPASISFPDRLSGAPGLKMSVNQVLSRHFVSLNCWSKTAEGKALKPFPAYFFMRLSLPVFSAHYLHGFPRSSRDNEVFFLLRACALVSVPLSHGISGGNYLLLHQGLFSPHSTRNSTRSSVSGGPSPSASPMRVPSFS